MRNFRKRRKLIKQMEQANKIPDKLMPQEIKDMLDTSGFRPIIDITQNTPEIKINGGRNNVLRCLAVVAAFVLVVGGFAVLRLSDIDYVKKYPETTASSSADTDGLDGLRGTTYKGLYNYIKDNKANAEDYVVDNGYIFQSVDLFSSNSYDQHIKDYQFALVKNQLTPNPCSLDLTQSGVDITPTNSCDEGTADITYGNAHFFYDNGGIDVYITQNGNITKSEQDVFADTFLKKQLVDLRSYEQYGCKFKPSVVAMYLENDELYAFFDFILPVKSGKKELDIEYCGMCVFNVSDPENIKLVSEFEQPGVIEGIRKVNGKFFIVSRYTEASLLLTDDQQPSDLAPARYVNGDKQLFEENEMYIVARENTPSMILLSSFDGNSQGSYMTSKLIACGESKVLMGTDNIYLLRGFCIDEAEDTPTRAMLMRINYNNGDMELDKTRTITGADADSISHSISGDEYNGRLSLFSNDSTSIAELRIHSASGSNGVSFCELWLFDENLSEPVTQSFSYDCYDYSSVIYNTFYHSMLYVYRAYDSVQDDDPYQQANNVQLEEAYDFSDPNKITQVTPENMIVAVNTGNYDICYSVTNYNDTIAVHTDTCSKGCLNIQVFDKSKAVKKNVTVFKSNYETAVSGDGHEYQIDNGSIEKIKKFDFFKMIQNYKYHEEDATTEINGKDYIEKHTSPYYSNSVVTDNENGFIAVPFYDSATYGKVDDGDNVDYIYYSKEKVYLLLMKYDIEAKNFSEYGTIKLCEYTNYYDDYYKNVDPEDRIGIKNDTDQKETYQSAFVQDGYIYIFTDKTLSSYSYDDLSTPVDSVELN